MGEREREGEREGERGGRVKMWKEGGKGRERERERETGRGRVVSYIISLVFNTSPLHPPVPGFFLMSLFFFGVCFVVVVVAWF